MDKFPLYREGRQAGELTVTREGLYDCFLAECRLPESPVYRAFAVGERGVLRLGVLEPQRGMFRISRRVPARETESLGKLLRGEARPPEEEKTFAPGGWQAVLAPEKLFRSGFLRQQLRGATGVLTREESGCRLLALPFDPHRPFLLTALFCFARIRKIGGGDYAIFAFDKGENPVFP